MYSIGQNINSLEFRMSIQCLSGVHPASVDKTVNLVLDQSSPNLKHSFPLTY